MKNPLQIERPISRILAHLGVLWMLILLFSVSVLAQANYTPYTFTTLAGTPGYGSADGTNSSAQFHQPAGVASDSAGNLYVADFSNNTIRKVTPDGVVTTLAGLADNRGSADGAGSSARFYSPLGVAVDSATNIYVADSHNNTIRKITPDGVVTTLAGLAGSSGSADGTNSSARFNGPYGVALDGAGNLYVADNYNHTIRKVTPDGVVTTLAGLAGSSGSADGTNSSARFYVPSGLASDRAGNLYVADSANQTIRKVTPDGVVTTLAGLAGSSGSTDGTGSSARFDDPRGVALDGVGNLYVADMDNDTIRRVTPDGVVTTLAGLANSSFGGADGTGSSARFFYPSRIALDTAGNLYVPDNLNCTIRKVTPDGVVTTLAGLAGVGGAADGTGSSARFNGPSGVALDSADNVYAADTGNHTIRKVTPDGVVTTMAGRASYRGSSDGTGSNARFYNPSGVAVDSAGNVYVADTGNHTIRKVTPGGVVTTLAGWPGIAGSADGTNFFARFDNPSGVAVDNAGYVYVADEYNSTIRKITPDGAVTTLAGLFLRYGSTDGAGSSARFFYPSGVAVDSAGNVYVAEYYNYTIRKITPDGVVTTLAGLANNSGCADGIGSNARFNYPSGVAVDSAGNLYVADTKNNTIRLGFALQPKLILGSPRPLNTEGLRLTLLCAPGSSYRVEASSDLVSWAPFTNFLSTNRMMYFQDSDAMNYTQRFYRAAAQ